MKKYVVLLMAIIGVFVILIGMSNFLSTNITRENEIIKGITEYHKASGDIRILKTKKDDDEFFVVYESDKRPIALCIFEENFFSFGRYYFPSGGSYGGLRDSFVFSEGTGTGHDALSVAYGYVDELDDFHYEVIIDDQVMQIKKDSNDVIFLDVYRHTFDDGRMISIIY